MAKGLAFPFRRGQFGYPAGSEGSDVIRDSLYQIFGVGRFERVMRPASGSTIRSYLFASDNSATREEIVQEVLRAIREQEPRVEVKSVEVEFSDSTYTILVSYTFRNQAFDTTLTLSTDTGIPVEP